MANQVKLNQIVNEVWEPLFIHKNGIRYIILMGGRGAGRSYVASQYAIAKLFDPGYFRCAIMRAVHSDIRLSLWQEINDRLEEQGVQDAEGLHLIPNSMTAEFETKTGTNSINAIGFRASSGARSAKLKSLAGYNTIIIEEAEEIGESEFMKLNDSLRTVKGEITVVFCLNTPPKSHWFIREFFDLEPSEHSGFHVPVLNERHQDDTIFLYYNFRSNLANLDTHTAKRYEEYRQTKPEYFYHMIEGLCPDTVRGRIYKDWKQIDEVPHEAKLVRRGLDYGWSPDPLHLCDIYYYNGGYILDQLLHGNEIENKQVAEVIKSQVHQAMTVADSAEPKSIAEIKSYGVNIVGAEKGQDSVIYGIKVVSGLRISVTKRSTQLWESYENYSWAETKDGVSLGIPSHYLSDPMDAARYGLVSIFGTISPEQEKKEIAKQFVQKQEFVKMTTRRHGL